MESSNPIRLLIPNRIIDDSWNWAGDYSALWN